MLVQIVRGLNQRSFVLIPSGLRTFFNLLNIRIG